MPERYLTLKQNDPDFQRYLWGDFSETERAIPVKTHYVGTPDEAVTFELQDYREIQRPGVLKFLSIFLKLHSFVLVMFPLFYVLVKNLLDGTIADPLAVTLATVAMLLLFAGLNIRNDIHDHLSGFDRVNTDAAVKPIRMGWITARRSSRVSLILIALSALFALPVGLLHRELFSILGVALVLFIAGKFARSNSYKQQHFGELILFVLMGPALVSGYQVAMGGGIDTEVLCFGVLWGYAVLYLIQVNNFSHIMTSSQNRIRNTMTKLGFDRAQKFLVASWVVFLLLWLCFQIFFLNVYFGILSVVLLLLSSIPLFKKIAQTKSPVGSGPRLISRQALQTFLLMVTVFTFEIVWSLWSAAR